jgi:hypothetical protein
VFLFNSVSLVLTLDAHTIKRTVYSTKELVSKNFLK